MKLIFKSSSREVPKKLTPEEMEEEKRKAEEEAKKPPKKKTGILSWFQSERWLQYKMSAMVNRQGGVKSTLETVLRRLDAIERALRREGYEMAPHAPSGKEADKEEERKRKDREEVGAKTVKRSPTIRIVEPEREVITCLHGYSLSRRGLY